MAETIVHDPECGRYMKMNFMKNRTNGLVPLILKGMVSLGYNSVSKILPVYLSSLGFLPATIAAINASYQLAKGVVGIIMGPIIDKIGWVHSFRLSVLATIAFLCILFVFVKEGSTFSLIFFGIGAALATVYFSIDAIATESRNKVEELSKLEMAYQIGFIAGPIIGGLIVAIHSFEAAVIFWIGSMVLSFIISLSLHSQKKIHEHHKSATFSDVKKIFSKDSLFILTFLALSGIFNGFIEGARDIAIPLHAINLGMGAVEVGAIYTISAFITVIFIVPLGKIISRIGNKIGIFIGVLLVLVSLVLFLKFNSFIALALLTGLLSLGRNIGYIGTRAFAAESMPLTWRATAFSIQQLFFSTGLVIGPLFSGFWIQKENTLGLFSILLILTAIFAVFLLIVLLWKYFFRRL